MHFNVFEHNVKKPFSSMGLLGNFWGINLDTLIFTWVSMAVLFCFVIFIRFKMKNPKSKFLFVVFRGFYYLADLVEENVGSFDPSVFFFITSVFLFTLFCNISGIIPFVEESTNDINTALAIGFSCFCFVQWQGIKKKGFGYFSKFFKPIFLFLPINILGQVSKVASLSFRLYGNILGGAIILTLLFNVIEKIRGVYFPLVLLSFLILYLSERYFVLKKYKLFSRIITFSYIMLYSVPGIQFFFGIFEGFVQAFVISLLTCLYISSEVSEKGGH